MHKIVNKAKKYVTGDCSGIIHDDMNGAAIALLWIIFVIVYFFFNFQ